MWKKIVDKITSGVLWAEKELGDKTGPEKKKLLIEQLVKVIDIPFIPDLVESPIERVLYGCLIDRACIWFNALTNNDFEGLVLNDEQKDKITEMIATEPEDLPEVPEVAADASVDEKLNAIYAKYTAGK
ncbi:MAG: hypothetical protein LBP21_05285 [Synergistaceae bacterium]|jgi:hypothetical protein|nr:hypothetical protein [Synergistaceae bacterium]